MENNIRFYRFKKQMTAEQLADKVNIHKMTLYRYEEGVRVPPLDVANKIAKALGCTVDDLLKEA